MKLYCIWQAPRSGKGENATCQDQTIGGLLLLSYSLANTMEDMYAEEWLAPKPNRSITFPQRPAQIMKAGYYTTDGLHLSTTSVFFQLSKC